MRRRLQEREIFEFKPEASELQNDVREITTPDFRLRKLVSLLEFFGRIKSNTHARLYTPRAPCALPRRRF